MWIGFSIQSLPDCVGFPHWGFPLTKHFFLFSIHPVIDDNCAKEINTIAKQQFYGVRSSWPTPTSDISELKKLSKN